LKVLQKLVRPTAKNDIWLPCEGRSKSCFPGIIMYFLTVFLKLRGRLPVIKETMKMNFNPVIM
jgi:hypothetical protein